MSNYRSYHFSYVRAQWIQIAHSIDLDLSLLVRNVECLCATFAKTFLGKIFLPFLKTSALRLVDMHTYKQSMTGHKVCAVIHTTKV